MLVKFDSKKEVVKEIIKKTKGGRGALAGAIGMSETTFNNKLYERNGCRFFDDEDLEAMEIHAGTYFLAQYRAGQRVVCLFLWRNSNLTRKSLAKSRSKRWLHLVKRMSRFAEHSQMTK